MCFTRWIELRPEMLLSVLVAQHQSVSMHVSAVRRLLSHLPALDGTVHTAVLLAALCTNIIYDQLLTVVCV